MPPTYEISYKKLSFMDWFPSYYKNPLFILGFITGFSAAATLFMKVTVRV